MSYSTGYRWEYRIHEKLANMVKVFNYLAPQKIDVPVLVGRSMQEAESVQDFRNVDFRYFKATFFKKRSCHITFLDQFLPGGKGEPDPPPAAVDTVPVPQPPPPSGDDIPF